MLSIRGVPDELENEYSQYKKLSQEIYDLVKGDAEPQRIPPDHDLFQYGTDRAVIYILEGYFKLSSGSKQLRLYTEYDFVTLDSNFDNLKLASEFSAEVVVFNRKTFLSRLAGKPDLLDKWLTLQDFEAKIDLALVSLSTANEVEVGVELKEFKPGEEITREGDTPTEIFELMSGRAKVLLDGQEIGSIQGGEIFGEISFLTEQARTATVVADNRCFVRIVKRDDFFSLVENNPHLGINISKTLAARIVSLNDKLITGSG